MTYRGALTELETLRDEYGDDISSFGEEYDMVWEACDKADRYRWHDLRKNPHVLPNIFEQVLVKAQIGIEEYEYGTASRVIGNDNGWTCFGYVVAWKRIEPYEVTK